MSLRHPVACSMNFFSGSLQKKSPLFCEDLLQKRPEIIGSLRFVATGESDTFVSVFVCVSVCVCVCVCDCVRHVVEDVR